jgi:hypothetical protein
MKHRPSAALVVSVVALVFAMTGTGLAASRYLVTSTNQIKPSVLEKLRGNRGAKGVAGTPGETGPAGVAGAQGPVGPAGPAGAAGATGQLGTNGVNGTNGTSVTVASEAAGANCATGGSKLTDGRGTTSYVCDGPSVARSDFQTAYAQTSLNPGQSLNAIATCPAGSVVTGGGYSTSSSQIIVADSIPQGQGEWLVSATLPSSAVNNAFFNAEAICQAIGN